MTTANASLDSTNDCRRSDGSWEAVTKRELDMRCNSSQKGEHAFEEHREIPRGSSTMWRFDSDDRTEFRSEPRDQQPDSCSERSPWVSGRYERDRKGQGSTKIPDVPLLDRVTITISVIEGRSKGLAYQLSKLCITVGRTEGGADFELDEPEATDVHCVIAARQDGVRLYVAPSVNNVYVNYQRIYTVELAHMSTFRVGSSLLLVRVLPKQAADNS